MKLRLTETEMALSIAKNGLLHPLTTYVDDGVEYLLDGKLRRKACRMAGVEPIYERYEGDDPAAFVIDMNSRRQHLDDPHLRASLVRECERECESTGGVQA